MPNIDPFMYAMPGKGNDTENIAFANAHGYEWGYVDAMRQAHKLPLAKPIPDGWAHAWLQHMRVLPARHMAIREGFAFWREYATLPGLSMTDRQENALRDLCARYKVEFKTENFTPTFDLPIEYVAGWIGEIGYGGIYVGCDADGSISS